MQIKKLIPATKDYIWGGTRLLTDYGKTAPTPICAETWELSYHKDGLTLLEDGTPICDSNINLGKNTENFEFFPQLIKFIDAKSNLSVQVHPSDEYALKNENSFGKTEMWYIVDADDGAGIYLGFKKDVTADEYKNAIENNTLTDLLNFYPVKKGECYFIPSGTIHAIGAGCLICEVQQNSNLTYRVYDYGRTDANGNPRELHIDKALKVTSLDKFNKTEINSGDIIALSKYFTVREIKVNGKTDLVCDKNSFKFITCTVGAGEINGQKMSQGDSFLIEACDGTAILSGNMTCITSEVRKLYIGIDLGGTFIKGGIVDDLGNILLTKKEPTESECGQEKVVTNIANLCKTLVEEMGLGFEDFVGIGMGVPGTVDSINGEVLYSNNLGWQNFKISENLTNLTGLPVKIANDANVAALGEAVFGCGKEYKDMVMLTLGTGVGGGLVLDGRLYEGNRSAGAELGHSVVVANGELCTCGRRGCLEAYASATALIRDTKRAMQNDKNSKMWQIDSLDNVDGATAFKFKDQDKTAKSVVDNYIEMLACGISNYANVFRPEAVILGGGVCNEGEALTQPLQKILNNDIFGKEKGPAVKIITATLGNTAGLLGAVALYLSE